MTKPKPGLFILSLDFELLWGVRDKRTIESYGTNLRGVRQALPAMLHLFEKYGVQATFATVGFLFARDRKELLATVPTLLPTYSHPRYSPYENGYLDRIGNDESDDIYHYAPSLIDQILQTPGQEIGTHTFSHFYCLEQASPEAFEADLRAAQKVAESYGVDLKTIVFPRNQYSQAHIDICRKLGIIGYRGNETSAVYQPRANDDLSLKIRGTRFLDSYINLTGHHTSHVEATDGIVNIPASRFLRPFDPRLGSLATLHLKRIKSGLTHAARTGTCFHLWWHPHNFGTNLAQNLALLEAALQHFQSLRQAHGMRSLNMRAIAEETLNYGR
jgi:hypothetical protein